MAIEIQRASDCSWQPTDSDIISWARLALNDDPADVTIRLVDPPEMTALNEKFRPKTGPTNVLSFGFEMPLDLDLNILGDVVICLPIIVSEAADQNKNVAHHFAHILIHGILHLKGFDHQTSEETAVMEQKEIDLLASTDINNPYEAELK